MSASTAKSVQNSASKVEEFKEKAAKVLSDASMYTPIRLLNTFMFDWKIKARVSKKQPIKDYNNAKGPGKLLNIELIDVDGTQI